MKLSGVNVRSPAELLTLTVVTPCTAEAVVVAAIAELLVVVAAKARGRSDRRSVEVYILKLMMAYGVNMR